MVFFVNKPNIALCLERFRAFLIGHDMKKFSVFGRLGMYIVEAENPIRAIQAVIAVTDSTAINWNAYMLSGYNLKMQQRIVADSIIL